MTSLEDAAHIIGEQRLLLQKMAEALKEIDAMRSAWLSVEEPWRMDTCKNAYGLGGLAAFEACSDKARAALTAYEKARSRAAINTQER